MESFGAALDRLTKQLVSELLAAVHASALERLAEERERETRAKPTRILRPSFVEPVATQPVVVRSFEIPVGQPRRRRRSTGASPSRKPALVPQPPQTFKFEVIPHPDRKNRRIVMTRVST
jgi:hypothetical protein